MARAIHDDGGTAEAFTADVTDEQQVARLVTAVAARLGPVDVLVLNATGRHRAAPPTPPPRTPRSAWPAAGPRLAPAGITVNTVAPGFIPVERHADVAPEMKNAYLASAPAGGWELLRTSPAR